MSRDRNGPALLPALVVVTNIGVLLWILFGSSSRHEHECVCKYGSDTTTTYAAVDTRGYVPNELSGMYRNATTRQLIDGLQQMVSIHAYSASLTRDMVESPLADPVTADRIVTLGIKRSTDIVITSTLAAHDKLDAILIQCQGGSAPPYPSAPPPPDP